MQEQMGAQARQIIVSKNILIFSDGTGQYGGLKPDQRLSNIYKLYSAARSSIENSIDPANQVAFYDPGLGTGESGGGWGQRLSRIFGLAFGTGISDNIADCYEAILKHYEPGDRIYLFGFSRGAYTARCVANVLNLCGVPQTLDGNPIPRGGKAMRDIAEEAVFDVYEHGAGKPRAEYEEEREEMARRFRAKYNCCGEGLDGEEQGNVAPYFIGVFDTVASLGTARARAFIFISFILSIGAALLAWFWLESAWATTLLGFPALWLLYKGVRMAKRQWKTITDWPKPGQKRSHSAKWSMKNADRFLDTNVRFARHACSIDEDRKHFPIAGWGNSSDVQRMDHLDPPWLRQVWFAGNHSDIGGSHPEDESRLSDIALQWMVEQLDETEQPIELNRARLNLWPDALGIQHDERRALLDAAWQSLLPRNWRKTWPQEVRSIHRQASLHPTVLERARAKSVRNYDRHDPYRPEALMEHELLQTSAPTQETATERDEPRGATPQG
jgi:uncharacterized protein (DUF2235 family)